MIRVEARRFLGDPRGVSDQKGGGAGCVAGVDEFRTAFGMRGYPAAGMGRARGRRLLGLEPGVDGATAGPEQQRPVKLSAFGRAQTLTVKFQNVLILRRNSQFFCRVAAKMLVREKKHAVAPRKGPSQHGFGIGRGTDSAAVLPHHGLESQRGG